MWGVGEGGEADVCLAASNAQQPISIVYVPSHLYHMLFELFKVRLQIGEGGGWAGEVGGGGGWGVFGVGRGGCGGVQGAYGALGVSGGEGGCPIGV